MMKGGVAEDMAEHIARMTNITSLSDAAEAVDWVTRTDPRFAVSLTEIRGGSFRTFANAPQSLRHLLIEQAALLETSELLIYGDERLSYAALCERVFALAQGLAQQCGIKKGDRVAIVMRNYPEYLIAVLALASLGAVTVYMNAWWTAAELEYGFTDSGARLAIVDGPRAAHIAPFAQNKGVAMIAVRDAGVLDYHFEALIASARASAGTSAGTTSAPAAPSVAIASDDDYAIMYTSGGGSTGHPKGVIVTHRSVISALWTWLMVLLIDTNNKCVGFVSHFATIYSRHHQIHHLSINSDIRN